MNKNGRIPFDLAQEHVKRWAIEDPHVFTILMADVTGWPIETLHDERMVGEGLHRHGRLLHSGVSTPDGRFVDARGVHDESSRNELRRLHSGMFDITEDYPIHFRKGPDLSIDDLGAMLKGASAEIDRRLHAAMLLVERELAPMLREALRAPEVQLEFELEP